MRKLIAHIKWFLAVIPVGLFATITAPFVYPLAYYMKWKMFWIWLDEEIKNESTNEG